MNIKLWLKKYKVIDRVIRIMLSPVFNYQYKMTSLAAMERSKGKIDDRFTWIKELKDSHLGERCFIVATGPSLLMSDLELIKNEYTFSMNSAILCFDKTSWRPSFYMIQDENVFEKIKNVVESNVNGKFPIVISDFIAKKLDDFYKFKQFPCHFLDHKKYIRHGFGEFNFSDDCYNIVYDGYSVTMSVLQFACYMGFKKIYLLGCDCNYNQKKEHFIDYGFHDPKAIIAGDKMIAAHIEFKKFADSIGVEVYNCTRGGMLEVYPRISLENVIRS